MVITFTDVTQLKQAEQLTEDAKEYAESIVETGPSNAPRRKE